MATALLDGRAEEVALELKQPRAFRHGPANGRQTHIGLIAHGEGEGQRAIGRVLHQTARRGLFDRHADPAVEIRIGRAIDRREIVEDFTRVIERTEPIQRLRVVFGQCHVPLIGGAGQQGAFHAAGRRLEIIGAASPHFVEVDLEVRFPAVEYFQLGAGFALGHGQPVAVQIGEIVVGAACGPSLDVFLVHRIGGGRIALPRIVPVGGAVATVRVLRRIDHDHGLVQPVGHLGGAAGGQIIGRQQSRFAAGRLIAVHAVEQPDHDRLVGTDRAAVRIGHSGMGALDVIDARLVGCRGDDHRGQRAVLIAAANVFDGHPIRQTGQLAQIGDDLVVAGEMGADRIAQKGLGRRDGGIKVGGAGLREIIVQRLGQHRCRSRHKGGPEQHGGCGAFCDSGGVFHAYVSFLDADLGSEGHVKADAEIASAQVVLAKVVGCPHTGE